MKNYLLVNRALAAEKKINLIEMLQGCSKRNGTTFRQSNPDGQPTVNRQSRLMSHQGWFRNLAMIFAVLVMSVANVGMAWGAEVTINPSESASASYYFAADGTVITSITGSGAASAGYNKGTPKITVQGKTGKNVATFAFTIGSGVTITSFKVNGTANNNSTYALDGTSLTIGTALTGLSKTGSMSFTITCTDGTSSSSNRNTTISSFTLTYTSAAPSTKRIYMKAGAWNNDSPKFFVHSWGSSDSDLQLTALGGCESDVFYADIPSGNTSLLFTRQNPSSSGIKYKDEDGNWNQSVDITISSNNLFTFNGNWSQSDGKSGFNGGTYSAPTTYTITYAANGGGGSMSATSGICPDADQAITSNAFTKPSGCASFAHWTANVAVKVDGATVTAGNPIANGATIQKINSNITLTAVWKLNKPGITDNEDNTFSISGSIDGASYYYTIDGATPTTSSSLYSAPVDFSAGAANITAKAIAHKDGYVDSDVKSQSCTYHEPPVCAISDCGNATLTYVINVGTSGSNASDRSDLITSATASNTTALGVSNSAGGNLTLSDNRNSAATTNACYPSKPAMTSKISVHNGESYSSSDYLQFAFTVKDGYTFTPCDIQFVVQPVSNPVSFRWEVTDGTSVYGYGTANNVPKGSSGGASVLTGITSPSAMEAGTYYIRLYPFYNGSGNTFRLGTDVILKGTTAAAACVAPTSVNITGTYHYFPGETISLTAAAEGGSGTPTTYQWYKGGTADGNIIEGATSATYSKANCTYADAGSYYCKVTRGGSCSTFSGNYDVKILHLYVKTGRNGTPDGDVDFVKVDATTARATISLGANWDYGFNIADGCGHYYGNTGSMNESNCTGWTMNVDGTDCLMRTTNGATYTFTVDYTTLTAPVVSITYPSANQAAGKVIYFDNNVLNWTGSSIYYRIGHSSHSQASQLSLVSGTANLYKMTTTEYNGFSGWHIANATGDVGSGKSIYKTVDGTPITEATAHEGGAVTESAVTVTPTTSRGNGSDEGINNNCEFYNYTITNGMKTQNVSITAPSNGTITVAYTDVEGASQSFTSGNRALAHTVIITPTATPTEGYTLSGLTVNGAAHTSGNTYTVTANTTIAATFTAKTYNITLDRNGASSGSESVTMTYNSSSHTAITAPVKAGYTFDGWYDSETDNNGSGNLVMNASGVLQENVTGFTGAGGIWIKDATCTLYAKWTAKQTTITINANTANHGSTTPGSVTATYGSALPSFTAATGASGWNLTGYFTTATSGTKVINADGTLVASTDYADGSSHWKYETATLTLFPQYEEEVSCTGDPTALVSGTLYQVSDMASACLGEITGTGQYFYGLSSNGKFYINGTTNANNASTGTVEMKTASNTIDKINFTGIAWFKGAGTTTCRSIKFVVPSAGTLTIYGKTSSGNGNVVIKTESSGNTTVIANSVNAYASGSTTVSAGTYYVLSDGGSAAIVGLKFVESACSTPAAPTAFAAGSITSTGATFTITDAAGAASYDIYYSTSSTAPTAVTAATTTSDSKTKAVTGLTASTTYYAWVRSVCDADHKSAWVALGTTSFTTVAAEPEALIHWIVTVDASTWSLNGSPTTTDGTNITSISSSIDAASSPSTGASGTTAKVALAAASDNVSNAASFTFTVNSAKKVEPERVTCQVFNVGSGSGDQLSYKAQLSDNNGHVYYSTNSVKPASAATLTDATFTFASDLVLTGNVTMKVYGYQDGGTKGTAFRMGADVKLFGEVQNAADYTVTHTLSNVTKSAGATSVKEGNNYTATYAGAGGSALPSTITVTIGGSPATAGTDYTWTQGTGVVSIPGNKVTGNIVITVTGVAPAPTYSVTHSLTNVTATSGATGASAATEGVAYNAVFAANTGYVLPSTITVTIGGSPATVGTGYTWNASTGAFQVPAAQVTGAIVVTIAGDEIEGDGCEELVNVEAATATTTTDNVGSSTVYNASGQTANSKSIKLNSSGYIELSPKAGKSFAAGDSLIIVMWNQASSAKTTGYRIAGTDYTASMPSKVNTTFRRKLIAADIVSSKVKIERESGNGSNAYFVSAIIKHCEDLPSCTPPTLPTLSNQTVCPGSDIAAWNAEPTNIATITGASQDVAYSWKKKGSDTELAATASFDLGSSATEGMAGTYVVTVTVSKTGYISKSASAEVDLTVTPATETPSITASKAKVYATDEVIFTATCGSTGVTWQWYRCTNAGGTITGSCLSTTSSYTLASAPAAGTYYYKAVATGDGTHSCGAAEYVYTLVVSADNSCDKEFWFAKEGDRPTGAAAATHITGCPSGSSSASYTASVDGTNYTLTGSTGQKTGNVTIVVPAGNTGTLYVVVQGSSSRTITLSKGGVQVDQQTPTNSVWGVYTVSDLDAGTYTLVSSGNISWGIIALKLCPTAACTDDTPTAAATNATVCAGGTITITATGYETGATFQWQKQNASTSVWEDIDGATSTTYTVATAAAEHAGNYHIVATKNCARTSNTVTIAVPTLPDFGSTVPASVSVMQTIALSINTVEATDAVKYRWYKSADATWDAGDTEIGTNKELIKAYDSEAIGSPSYYIFCRAQNACGITTSSAIAVTVTAYVEEDCATRGNEGSAEFSFENSGCGQGSYQSANCWTMNSNSKILVYYPPTGKYFKTAKVTIASSSETKASYNWSTNGGTDYTAVSLTVNSTLTERTIELSDHGNVNAFQIGRNFDSKGSSGGTLYVSKICFEYTDACTATTVTPDESSKTYEMGSGSFTESTFTVKHGGTAFDPQPTLTYSSSNEDIASVDDDGTVTFNGEAGTVTITASYAGGTISETEYCASSGSYTITVSCPGGAPKVVASGSVDMSGCNSSVTLLAKTQADGDFADGTYQWFRNGEEIDGATSSSYTATQAGTYTVARTNTSDCTTPSTNSAIVTSETTEPEVERLVPFQYYHVDKTYTDQMKMRHLFAVKNSGTLDGKHFKMYVSRNGGAAMDVTSSNALVVVPNGDGHVDTVMVDLNKLSGKYEEDDELVFTCKAIDCTPAVSETYKATITMHVIDETPTLALICSGSSKAEGTRKTGELTVGGDFLTGYNVADLCQQTGNTSFDANTEWGLYTDLKAHYIVTPVNGYAVFNKLNYEPFDILLLTDYPKASKSDAAAAVLDDMAALCDYRPMLSFKTHMVAKSPSKWAEKGFTTSPVVPKNTRTRLNIVCYAHPMFADMKETATHIQKDNDDPTQIVYTMLEGAGYESSKGLQGFELEAAENFVTIGLVHYNASPADATPSEGLVTWTPGSEDRMLVTAVERQENPEARMIMFAVNCGAQSKFTETGRDVVLKCLKYLLTDATITPMADCSFTFDNGAGNTYDAATQASKCPSCTGTKGDGKWSTAANWGPDYVLRPGKDTEVKIAAPVTVDPAVGTGAATNFTPKVRSVRIVEGGKIEIPAGSYLEVVSTIRRQDGNDLIPTEVEDLHIGSSETGNGTLILNNSTEDTKAQVDMYSKGFIDHTDPEKEPNGVKNYQYIGTPFVEVNALYNYYGSWIYSWGVKKNGNWGWVAVKNGGPMTAWTGYCITQEEATYHQMSGTLTATGTKDIDVPAGQNMVVGNSWTAPIDISKFAATDFENLEANVYFFNTGVDKTGTAGAAGSRYAGSTYVTVPINTAPYTEDDHIPSLQGFFVKSNGSAGTLHLDYDKHVRGSSRAGRLSEEMHAPARRAALSSDEPVVLKMKVSGENYDDKLLLLEREDFTEGFDNGWDGDKWDGNESALYIYTTDNNGTENSVSAIPELEGTVIGFRAGEDDAYTLNFEYLNSDEPLYLYDVENNTYTQIMTGMTYRFFTTDNEKHERFIITRSNGQEVATGVESTSGSLDRSKAKKLLIEDKMFIMVNGMLYDATGKLVK